MCKILRHVVVLFKSSKKGIIKLQTNLRALLFIQPNLFLFIPNIFFQEVQCDCLTKKYILIWVYFAGSIQQFVL